MTDASVSLLARPDLADARLQGLVRARRHAPAAAMQTSCAALPIRAEPRDDAEQLDQLIFGEVFDVLEEQAGRAWGRARRDGTVGWVEVEGLSAPVLRPTHTVTALRAYALAEPQPKAAAVGLYSLNALVTVEAERDGWLRGARCGWFPAGQLSPVGRAAAEPAEAAERFLNAPWFHGGRESLGLDGAALVQQALYAAGLAGPRRPLEQAALGRPVEGEALRRGDLVLWREHAAVMIDERTLVHADPVTLVVRTQPLAEASAALRSAGHGEPTARRRLAA